MPVLILSVLAARGSCRPETANIPGLAARAGAVLWDPLAPLAGSRRWREPCPGPCISTARKARRLLAAALGGRGGEGPRGHTHSAAA